MWETILTKDVLNKLYIDEKKTAMDIASIYGCNDRTVSYYLKKYSLPLRSFFEVSLLRWHKNISKDELVDLYVENNMGLISIASLFSCSTSTIVHYLNKYNINVRDMIDAQRLRRIKTIPIFGSFAEILNGLLLSDGCLTVPSTFQAYYRQTSNQEGFISYIVSVFRSNNYFKNVSYYRRFDSKYNKYYDTWNIRSVCTVELRELYNKWYPDGKKHVPIDIKLTPETVLFWYLGDGSRIKDYKGAYLSTCSFSIDEQEILVAAFKHINIDVKIIKSGKYHTLRIAANNFDSLMEYMGHNPVSCYDYKFSKINK